MEGSVDTSGVRHFVFLRADGRTSLDDVLWPALPALALLPGDSSLLQAMGKLVTAMSKAS